MVPHSNVLTEDLRPLLMALRSRGFSIGTDTVLKIEMMVRAIAETGRGVTQPLDLGRIVGPIVCKSAGDQEEFSRIHAAWRQAESIVLDDSAELTGELAQVRIERTLERALTQDPAATERVERTARRSRWLMWVGLTLAVALGIALFLSGYLGPDTPKTLPANTPITSLDRAVEELARESNAILRLLLAGLVFLVPIGFWWIQTHRLRVLQRRFTTRLPQSKAVSLQTARQGFFANARAEQSVQLLRQHRLTGSRNLDVRRTLEEAIRNAGLTRLIYRNRRVLPEHVLLVDRSSEEDHLRGIADLLERRLIEANAPIIRFEFQKDPRVVRRRNYFTGGMEESLTLRDLAALFSNQRLILLTDASGLFYSLSGRSKPWIDDFKAWEHRAILTPKPPSEWGRGERELELNGFVVGEASSNGLRLIAETFRAQEGADFRVSHEAGDDRSLRPFPPRLEDEPARWLEEMRPDPGVVAQLLDELRLYLGDTTFHWCCACAAFPKLHPELTMHLGVTLKGASGESIGSEEGLLALAQLPWFRKGFMPDWLRLSLLVELDARERKRIVTALIDVLLTAKEGGSEGLVLDISEASSSAAVDFIQRTSAPAGRNNPMSEEIFLSFLHGRELPPLAIAAPHSFILTVRRVVDPVQVSLWLISAIAFGVLYALDPGPGFVELLGPWLTKLLHTVHGQVIVAVVIGLLSAALGLKRLPDSTVVAVWFVCVFALLASSVKPHSLSALITLLISVLTSVGFVGLLWMRGRLPTGTERSLYLLGSSFALYAPTGVVTELYYYNASFLAVAVVSAFFALFAGFVAFRRRGTATSVELAVHWLTCSVAVVVFAGCVLTSLGVRGGYFYGLIAGAVASLVLALVMRRWAHLGPTSEADSIHSLGATAFALSLPVSWFLDYTTGSVDDGLVLVLILSAIVHIFILGTTALRIGGWRGTPSDWEFAVFWLGGLVSMPCSIFMLLVMFAPAAAFPPGMLVVFLLLFGLSVGALSRTSQGTAARAIYLSTYATLIVLAFLAISFFLEAVSGGSIAK